MGQARKTRRGGWTNVYHTGRRPWERCRLIESLESRTLLSASLPTGTTSDPIHIAANTAEIDGTIWNDATNLGTRDASEAGLSGWTAYSDANNNSSLDQTTNTVASATLSVAVADGGTVTNNLTVSGQSGTIGDVNALVKVTLTQGAGLPPGLRSDLAVFLTSPAGTRVQLFNNINGIGPINNTLDDEAGHPLSVAADNGSYRPDGRLSDFDGENPNGTWTLELTGDAGTPTSDTLTGWSLIIAHGEPATQSDDSGQFALRHLAAGSYTIREVSQAGWTQTAPSGGTYIVPLADGQIAPSRDFGNFAQPGPLSGKLWNDWDGDGILDVGEPALAGWTVFLDTNNNGALDPGETATPTDGSGQYSFSGLSSGYYNVAIVLPVGWQQTSPVEQLYSLTQVLTQTTLTPVALRLELATPLPIGTSANSTPRPTIPLPAPYGSFNGPQGLALSPNSLFYLDGSTGQDQILYELDPSNGQVIDADVVASAGSAPFGGLAYLNGLVYLVQSSTDTIVAFNPNSDLIVSSVHVNADLSDALTGAGDLGRLFGATPGNTGPGASIMLLGIDPGTGVVVSTTPTVTPDLIPFGLPPLSGLAYYAGGCYYTLGPYGLFVLDSAVGHARAARVSGISSASGPLSTSMGLASDGAIRSRRVLVRGDLNAQANFGNVQSSAVPITPDLMASSDSGASDTDNITANNASSPQKLLRFQIDGIVVGATVRLYGWRYSGSTTMTRTLLGSAVANGASTLIDVTSTVADGTIYVTAEQQEPNKASIASPSSLTVVIDTFLTPTIAAYQPNQDSISIDYAEAATGLALADLTLTRNGQAASLAGATLTTTGNGKWFLGNIGALMNQDGAYAFTVAGPSSLVRDVGGNAPSADVTATWTVQNIDASDQPDMIVIRNVDSTHAGVFINNVTATPDYTFPLANYRVQIHGMAGDDTLTEDFSAGKIMPTGGILFDGGDGADSILIAGAASGSYIYARNGQTENRTSPTSVQPTLQYSGTEHVGFDTMGGSNHIDLHVQEDAAVELPATQALYLLSLSDTAKVTVSGPATQVLTTFYLLMSGSAVLDLTNHDLLVTLRNYSDDIASLVRSGAAAGIGIISSALGANQALGYAAGDDPAIAYLNGMFRGQAFTATAMIVARTLIGDANLDGSVDGSDVALWAQNFSGALGANPAVLKTWAQGDWNHDGSVDGSDVALWAQNFTGAPGAGAPGIASALAPAAQPLMASSQVQQSVLSKSAKQMKLSRKPARHHR